MMGKPLFLVGFMGVGKTSVGKKLSQDLFIPFLDMDQVISQREKQRITTIFSKEGEAYFRMLEAELLLELVSNKGVVATGGGIICSSLTREHLKKQKVYWLKASFETIVKRVSQDSLNERPLFDAENLSAFKQLYEERQELYYEVADEVIEVDELTVTEIAKQIKKHFEMTEKRIQL